LTVAFVVSVSDRELCRNHHPGTGLNRSSLSPCRQHPSRRRKLYHYGYLLSRVRVRYMPEVSGGDGCVINLTQVSEMTVAFWKGTLYARPVTEDASGVRFFPAAYSPRRALRCRPGNWEKPASGARPTLARSE